MRGHPICSVLVVGFLLAPPAFATAPSQAPPPPGGASVTPDGKVAISASACKNVMARAREGADYVPGVDANGKAVAPADLPVDASSEGPIFTIVIDQKLTQSFGISGDARLFRPQVAVGVINVQGNTILFNGAPLASTEIALLVAECRAHGFAPR